MKLNEKKMDTWEEPVYERTKRSAETYDATTKYITSRLKRLVFDYKQTKLIAEMSTVPQSDLQVLRLIRDEIEHNLRRYHGYSIKGSIGAHYKQVGIEKGIFEHMVPVNTIRNLLIDEYITPWQACNMPTCLLSKQNDLLLRKNGLVSSTPSIYKFWRRYEKAFVCDGNFKTHDGKHIDTKQFNLNDHFKLFGGAHV